LPHEAQKLLVDVVGVKSNVASLLVSQRDHIGDARNTLLRIARFHAVVASHPVIDISVHRIRSYDTSVLQLLPALSTCRLGQLCILSAFAIDDGNLSNCNEK
jgi:hypothetical protein